MRPMPWRYAVGLLLTFLCPAFGAGAITIFAVAFIALLIAGNVWLWTSAQLACRR